MIDLQELAVDIVLFGEELSPFEFTKRELYMQVVDIYEVLKQKDLDILIKSTEEELKEIEKLNDADYKEDLYMASSILERLKDLKGAE